MWKGLTPVSALGYTSTSGENEAQTNYGVGRGSVRLCENWS